MARESPQLEEYRITLLYSHDPSILDLIRPKLWRSNIHQAMIQVADGRAHKDQPVRKVLVIPETWVLG
jgi:hypothetical protein